MPSCALNLFNGRELFGFETSHHYEVVLVSIYKRENEHVAEPLRETDFKHVPAVEFNIVSFYAVIHLITITTPTKDIEIIIVMWSSASTGVDSPQIHRSKDFPVSLLKRVSFDMTQSLFFHVETSNRVHLNVYLL